LSCNVTGGLLLSIFPVAAAPLPAVVPLAVLLVLVESLLPQADNAAVHDRAATSPKIA
jgi:hypothetical protein